MSEQDECHDGVFLDTTDEGYLNYLLSEANAKITTLTAELEGCREEIESIRSTDKFRIVGRNMELEKELQSSRDELVEQQATIKTLALKLDETADNCDVKAEYESCKSLAQQYLDK